MATGDDLQERLVDFAVGVIRVCAGLPKNAAGRHLADQCLRSGTVAAPDYAEARGAESRKDFVHKLRIALKELNETAVWLRILDKSNMLPSGKVDSINNSPLTIKEVRIHGVGFH